MSIGPYIKIKNETGFELKLESFQMFYTYEGYLEWHPEELPEEYHFAQNKDAINKLKEGIRKKFPPQLKVEFKNPTNEELRQHMLKAMCFVCEIISNKPISDNYTASSLVYVWLDDVPFAKTIEEIIVLELKTLNWLELAQDFDY